jgi:hypothetical protein
MACRQPRAMAFSITPAMACPPLKLAEVGINRLRIRLENLLEQRQVLPPDGC